MVTDIAVLVILAGFVAAIVVFRLRGRRHP
jgi:hypothetical protein